MTKEITKAHILQELQDKFALRDLEPERFTFQESVAPVYDIARHLTRVERKAETRSITAAGAHVFFTCPADEWWALHRYTVVFVTGVYTVAGVLVGRPTAAEYVYLDLSAATAVSYMNDLPKDVAIRPGDVLYINVDGYTSTGDLLLIIDVDVEKIR